MRHRFPLPIPVLLFLAAGACSDSSSPSGGGGLAVTVGDNFFKSTHNSGQNPAIDTIAVGGKVTWTWSNTTLNSHSIESDPANPGDPTFPSSAVKQGAGQSYTVTFGAAGSYDYDCSVHGPPMQGTIVVQ